MNNVCQPTVALASAEPKVIKENPGPNGRATAKEGMVPVFQTLLAALAQLESSQSSVVQAMAAPSSRSENAKCAQSEIHEGRELGKAHCDTSALVPSPGKSMFSLVKTLTKEEGPSDKAGSVLLRFSPDFSFGLENPRPKASSGSAMPVTWTEQTDVTQKNAGGFPSLPQGEPMAILKEARLPDAQGFSEAQGKPSVMTGVPAAKPSQTQTIGTVQGKSQEQSYRPLPSGMSLLHHSGRGEHPFLELRKADVNGDENAQTPYEPKKTSPWEAQDSFLARLGLGDKPFAKELTADLGGKVEKGSGEVFSLKDPKALSQFLSERIPENSQRSIELKMDPPNLGKVTAVLSSRGDEVTVKFLVHDPSAARSFQGSWKDLSLAFAEKGLLLSGFTVDHGQDFTKRENLAEGKGQTQSPSRRVRTALVGSLPTLLPNSYVNGDFDYRA